MESEIKQLKKQVRRTEIWAVIGLVCSLIKLLQPLMNPAGSAPPVMPTNTNSVEISNAAAMAREPQRDYLRTEEVAEREGVAERTVISWVRKNRFDPMPVQRSWGWEFAADYRVLPSSAEAEEVASEQ